jgi:bifunctional non-homologous end joining protein LigD
MILLPHQTRGPKRIVYSKGPIWRRHVMLRDCGYWEPEGRKSPEAALKKGDFKCTLKGKRLQAVLSWCGCATTAMAARGPTVLIKHYDDHSVEENGAAILEENATSVASGRSMEQIAEGKGRKPRPFMMANAV